MSLSLSYMKLSLIYFSLPVLLEAFSFATTGLIPESKQSLKFSY
jgi:hypothetical protein